MSSSISASAIDVFCAAVSKRLNTNPFVDDVRALAVDAMLPDVAVAPADETALSNVLAEAQDAGLTVIPVGGAEHLGVGNVPEAFDVAISLARMDGVIAYEPDDLTITLQPGVRLDDVQTLTGQHGQFLPLDPPSGLNATIGGVVAANVSGPMRHFYGMARDWVIGMRVVAPDGSVSKSGGRVVKNVAGYDMAKLHIGALGTLGIISEVTFKLAPLPPSMITMSIGCDTAHAGALLAFAAHDEGLALQSMELLSPPAAYAILGESRWSLLVRAGGPQAAVDRTISELQALSLGLNARLGEAPERAWASWRATFAPGTLALRASVLPSETAEIIEVLDRRFTGAAAMLSATVTAGLIRANLDAQRVRPLTLIDHAHEAVKRRCGRIFLDAAPPLVKRQYDVFGPLRGDIALMRRMKEQFDPKRTLAPGRFCGRI
jgi:glycolate oxidase FAD binding subunit